MDTQHVDSSTISVWRWQGALTALLLVAPAVGITMHAPDVLWPIVPLYLALSLTLAWRVPAAYYRALVFAIDAHGITIHRGLLWRSSIALPRVRVQHSDVSQGPLQRRYGVATLKLYTAGSRFTKIELPGLAHAEALALRNALLAQGGDSGV